MKKLLAIVTLLCCAVSPVWAECSKADNYVAQFKIRELLPAGDLWHFDDMSLKQLGNEHWWLRKKLIPWAKKIKDVCVRQEMLDYIRAESSSIEDTVRDRKLPPNNGNDWLKTEGQLQDLGKDKKEKLDWPPLPK